MQKKSSRSSRKPAGSGYPQKKDNGKAPYGKSARPAFKRDNDGRKSFPDKGSGESRARPSAGGYSTDKKRDRPYGTRSFDNNTAPEGKGPGANRFRKEGDNPRSFRDKPGDNDRPKRRPDSFEKKGGRDNEGKWGDRPPKDFKKPGFRGERKQEGDRKQFKSFDKPESGDTRNPEEGRKPFKRFDKPESPDGRKPWGARKQFKNFDKPGSRDEQRPEEHKKQFRSFDKPGSGDERKPEDRGKQFKPFDKPRTPDSRPFRDREKPVRASDKKDKDFKKTDKNVTEKKKSFGDVMDQAFNTPKTKKKEADKEDIILRPQQFEDKVYGVLEEPEKETVPKRPFKVKPKESGKAKPVQEKATGRKRKYEEHDDEDEDDDAVTGDNANAEMPLNKYVAHSGECSRRDAAELVKQGKVKVNGELVLDPGYRVKSDDQVTMSGKKLTPQKGMVYILLNKPKGFITTNDDPQGRKTVMELVGNSGVDRLFPVGRLDRDTSGLLLITNDGELTQKLCHPSFAIKKVYQVTLDKPLTKADFDKIVTGVDLEDGLAHVDALAYLEKKNELGLEIHSGRNRIVRRIFESLGYVVDKLDRVMYAGLTKKNLPRSKWRYLNEREVVLLKHFKS